MRGRLPALQSPRQYPTTAGTPSNEKLDLIETVFAAQTHPDYINISLACPQHSDFFPTARLQRIIASLLRRESELLGRYALPPGSPRLRREIARRALDLGLQLTADDVTLTHGCMEAIQLALRTVTTPGDCVGVETPTYFYLFPLMATLGLKIVEIPTDPQNGLALDALELLLRERRLQAIITMPTVQNPLGCSMPLAEKKRLAAMVTHYQVPSIEDGLYGELQFCWPLSPAVKAFDQEGWVLYCSKFHQNSCTRFPSGLDRCGTFQQKCCTIKICLFSH
ncbi:MAG: HTH-type transcriptional regulator NorG [Candidatus Erwinia impunctatus]